MGPVAAVVVVAGYWVRGGGVPGYWVPGTGWWVYLVPGTGVSLQWCPTVVSYSECPCSGVLQ